MHRLVLAAGLTAILGFGFAGRMNVASADLFWCSGDPIVTIDGQVYDVDVAIAPAGLGQVQGDVPIALVVPYGSTAQINSVDTRYFVPDAAFFHADQAAAAAQFLGVAVQSVEYSVNQRAKGGVLVLTVVHSGLDEFPTLLSVSNPAEFAGINSNFIDEADSNNLLAVHFQPRSR